MTEWWWAKSPATTPFPSPLLPVMRRDKGTMGVVVRVGGFAHPHHLPLLIPPSHTAEQRVEGARGWSFSRLTVRLSNYLFRFTC